MVEDFRGQSDNSRNDLQAEWDKRLEAEGMPPEIVAEVSAVEHSPAYDEAVAQLEEYFLTTDRTEFSAHRKKVEELLGAMKSASATDEEVEAVEEDMDAFAHSIEDKVTTLMNDAVQAAREVAEKRPALVGRKDSLARVVMQQIKKFGESVHEQTIRRAAELAAEMVVQ